MTEVILTSGSSWTVPDDCTSATVECIGGGQGGNATNGGNGGDYAKANAVALTPGASIAVAIGAGGPGVASGSQNAGGDTSFGSAVLAKGGGSASADVGDTTFAGGAGNASGAGGGAAGPNAAGGAASGTTGGQGDGTAGGAGGTSGNAGAAGIEWGTAGSGGGGGASASAPTSPVLVQQKSTGQGGAATSSSLTLNSAPTAGNTLLLVAREFTSGDAITPSGWTLIAEKLPTGSSRPAAFYMRTSDGTEQTITVNFGSSNGHGIAVQEWQGTVTFGTMTGVYIPSISDPQQMGPTDAPPNAGALPSMFLFWDNLGTNTTSWPAGWTNTTNSYSFAHNPCEIGTMTAPPGAAVSPSINFASAPSSFMYWWNIWVRKP